MWKYLDFYHNWALESRLEGSSVHRRESLRSHNFHSCGYAGLFFFDLFVFLAVPKFSIWHTTASFSPPTLYLAHCPKWSSLRADWAQWLAREWPLFVLIHTAFCQLFICGNDSLGETRLISGFCRESLVVSREVSTERSARMEWSDLCVEPARTELAWLFVTVCWRGQVSRKHPCNRSGSLESCNSSWLNTNVNMWCWIQWNVYRVVIGLHSVFPEGILWTMTRICWGVWSFGTYNANLPWKQQSVEAAVAVAMIFGNPVELSPGHCAMTKTVV